MLPRLLFGIGLAIAVTGAALPAWGDPEADRAALRKVYEKRFPNIPLAEHKDGAYTLDAGAREQWLELEDFPPYEIAQDEGAELFEMPLADGTRLEDCLGGADVKSDYPYVDAERGEVITLEMAINACRTEHGDEPLGYDSEELAALMTYLAYQIRGEIVNVPAPSSEAELAAYEAGKAIYLARRGQLNFACVNCHVDLVGNDLRAERLSASVGHATHWPVYRLKWQEVGTLHRRFQECNSQIGAEALPLQSRSYRNLEYFLTFMSNGLEWNGPSSRK